MLRFLMTRCFFIWVLIFGFLTTSNSFADENLGVFTFKKLLMPGELNHLHKKYEADCESCHVKGSGGTQNSLCLDCHEAVEADLRDRTGFHGKVAADNECKSCHGEHLGRDGDIVSLDRDRFDHGNSDFILEGAHVIVACDSCHVENKLFRDTKSECVACHKNDDRHGGAMGDQCENCHTSKSWIDNTFNHDDTGFALLGEHKSTSCSGCHPDQKFEKTPSECVACHAVDDPHRSRNGNQCDSCHAESDWNKLVFDHDRDTGFTLKGHHRDLTCNACHRDSSYDTKIGGTCIDCHQKDDQHDNRFGKKCQSCHASESWKKTTFDHTLDTDFTLLGKHKEVSCDSCHRVNALAAKLSTACVDCHKKNDVHEGEQGKECSTCHNNQAWFENVRFNHDLTLFPLVGMHAATGCESCHSSRVFKEASGNCEDCHLNDDFHEKTLGPNCSSCHNPNDWGLWVFDHDSQTDFILDGAHGGLSCRECHTRPVKNRPTVSSSCGTCHLNDDVHNRRFGRVCERCHTTESFKDIRVK